MTLRVPTGERTPLDSLVDVLIRPSRRISFLILVAYVSAFLGLALSFIGDVGRPSSAYTTAGIALMALSFVSLLVVSLTVLDLLPDDRQ